MHKLYLHIGTEKTGSTSIQRFLTKNASLLLSKHGILWPQDPKVFRNNGHFPIAGSFLDPKDCDFLPQKAITTPLDAIAALKTECDNRDPRISIISAEHFSSRFNDSNISELARLLADFDVTVLVYVRRQDKMALSYFSTGVRYGRREWFSQTEVNPSNSIYNIRALLDAWSRYFGKDKIEVRIFEKSKLIGGDVLVDLLSLLGVENNPDFQTVDFYENKALTLEQIGFLIDINKHLPTWKEAADRHDETAFRSAQELREHAIKTSRELESFSNASKLSSLLSMQDRREILGRFSEDNRYVAETFLGKSMLFDDVS